MKPYIKELMYYLFAGLMIWYCIILISDGIRIKESISLSVDRCMNIIIPSLFAFMAASGIIVSSGIYAVISRPFAVLSKYLIGLPMELFSVFIISNAAGYPVGAKLICDLYDERRIDKHTAETMLCFCYGAGPAFLSSAVGLALFASVRIGMIIFASCALSNLVIASVMCHITKLRVRKTSINKSFHPQMITDQILLAEKSLFGICAMIVFFSTVMAVLDHYSIISTAAKSIGISGSESYLRCLIEISELTKLTNAAFSHLPVISGLCSFGGVCVILQVAVLVKNRFSMRLFLITRPIAAALSVLNCFWLCKFLLPDSVEAFAGGQHIFVKVNNFVPSVCLILMIFLLKIKKRVAFSN